MLHRLFDSEHDAALIVLIEHLWRQKTSLTPVVDEEEHIESNHVQADRKGEHLLDVEVALTHQSLHHEDRYWKEEGEKGESY